MATAFATRARRASTGSVGGWAMAPALPRALRVARSNRALSACTAVTALSVCLLAGGVAWALARPGHRPAWIGPVVAACVAVAAGVVPVHGASDALRSLRDPLLFLLLVVPLAA